MTGVLGFDQLILGCAVVGVTLFVVGLLVVLFTGGTAQNKWATIGVCGLYLLMLPVAIYWLTFLERITLCHGSN